LLDDGDWQRARGASDEVWNDLVSVHRALGGKDKLEELRAVIADRELAARCCDQSNSYEHLKVRWQTAYRLEPAVAPYVRYKYKALVDGAADVPWPDAPPYQAGMAQVALDFSEQEDRPAEMLIAAWEVVNQPAALDSNGSPFSSSTAEAAAAHYLTAAKTLVKNKSKLPAASKDPLWPAIDGTATGKKYDGAGHLEAAKALVKAKQPERAWTALINASFFGGGLKGKARPDAYKAAKALADEAKWKHIAGALAAMEHAHLDEDDGEKWLKP
jgi:hypothetical protein